MLIRQLCLAVLILSLTACDSSTDPESTVLSDSNPPATTPEPNNQALSTELNQDSTGASESEPESTGSLQQLRPGEFLLTTTNSLFELNANQASRKVILDHLTESAKFELVDHTQKDVSLSGHLPYQTIEALLREIVDDVAYRLSYGPVGTDSDVSVKIQRMELGNPVDAVTEDSSSGFLPGFDVVDQVPVLHLAAVPDEEAFYFGADPDSIDLSSRLQHATTEERAQAVSELSSDPTGMNAAYRVFQTDPDPEVRKAVLELVETEDYFLARQMLLMALNDDDPQVISVALNALASGSDFTLVPYLNNLKTHYDAEVRAQAQEMVENLTSGYYSPRELDEIIANRPPQSEQSQDDDERVEDDELKKRLRQRE